MILTISNEVFFSLIYNKIYASLFSNRFFMSNLLQYLQNNKVFSNNASFFKMKVDTLFIPPLEISDSDIEKKVKEYLLYFKDDDTSFEDLCERRKENLMLEYSKNVILSTKQAQELFDRSFERSKNDFKDFDFSLLNSTVFCTCQGYLRSFRIKDKLYCSYLKGVLYPSLYLEGYDYKNQCDIIIVLENFEDKYLFLHTERKIINSSYYDSIFALDIRNYKLVSKQKRVFCLNKINTQKIIFKNLLKFTIPLTILIYLFDARNEFLIFLIIGYILAYGIWFALNRKSNENYQLYELFRYLSM